MVAPSTFNVLVIDDAPAMRQVITGCFHEIGFKNVTQAPDGEAAWNQIQTAMQAGTPFTLIACDWNMPKMTGIALLKRVRLHPLLKSTPFLMVTAEAARESVMEAVSAGVSNYIVKPFSPTILREKLKKVIPGITFEES